jgi:hypothetical protein
MGEMVVRVAGHQIQLLQVVRQLLDKVSQAVVTQAILIQVGAAGARERLVKTLLQIQQRQQVVSVFPLIHHGDLQQQQDKTFRALFIMVVAVQVELTLAQVGQELLSVLMAGVEFQVETRLIHQD